MHSSLLMLWTAQSVVLCTGLTKLRSLRMDSCKALHPKGSDHFRFLAGMPGLTELSWRAHSGKPDWIEPDASVAGAEIGAMCLLMHAHKLTNLQRWVFMASSDIMSSLICPLLLGLGGCQQGNSRDWRHVPPHMHAHKPTTSHGSVSTVLGSLIPPCLDQIIMPQDCAGHDW